MTQGIISIIALVCLGAGLFNFFSPELNSLLSRKIFYILIGIGFFAEATFLSNRSFAYPLYAAALMCVLGAYLLTDTRFAAIKTIGLIIGVIFSLCNRTRHTL
ncbi:hypothetical protein [Chryseobacterium sp.]|uniref:hypothetical protein n=1 Tax=Chryseobacterium sp. TaxID=1871047 RepID=UPI0025C0C4E8|nr:hypothetical protein [Chryseobacterium sp.]